MSRPPARDAESQTPASPPRRGCLRKILFAAAVCALLLILGALYLVFQTRRTPSFYEQQQQRFAAVEEAELARVAEAFEQRTLQAATTVEPMPLNREPDGSPGGNQRAANPDPSAPRELTIGVREANAWLRTRLESWMANQQIHLQPEIREAVTDPVIGIEDGLLAVAAQFTPPASTHGGQTGGPRSSQVISLYLDLAMTPDQRVEVTLQRVRIGRLSLPINQIVPRLDQMLTGQDRELLTLVQRAIDGIPLEPIIPLPGSQELRILDLAISEDHITLLVQPLRGELR